MIPVKCLDVRQRCWADLYAVTVKFDFRLTLSVGGTEGPLRFSRALNLSYVAAPDVIPFDAYQSAAIGRLLSPFKFFFNIGTKLSTRDCRTGAIDLYA